MDVTLHELERSLASLQVAIPSERIDNTTPLPPPPPLAEEKTNRGRLHGVWKDRWVPAPDRDPALRDEAQRRIWRELETYLRTPSPDHMIVLAAETGFGKTWLMARLATTLAMQGHSVFYAGVRRNFWHTVMAEVEKQEGDKNLWMQWLPRQDRWQAEQAGGYETCSYGLAMNEWMKRGYNALHFCQQKCGWDYIQNGCAYYEQQHTPANVIYGHHNHIFLGNLMFQRRRFDLLIGDEEAISSAILHPWLIPMSQLLQYINVPDFANSPVTDVTSALARLCVQNEVVQGFALIEALGGPQRVIEAYQYFEATYTNRNGSDWAPTALLQVDGNLTDDVPVFFLPELMRLLRREALWVLNHGEKEYLTRIIVRPHGHNAGVELLLRRDVHPDVPQHIIWCDATPEATIYEAAFDRKVKILYGNLPRKGKLIQVASRANGKTLLTGEGEADQAGLSYLRDTAQQTLYLVQREQKELEKPTNRWGVVTYKEARWKFEEYGAEAMHFGGARGENSFTSGQALDAGFVVGTPMPRLTDIVRIAKMLWSRRMEPFNVEWSDLPYPFKGTGTERVWSHWYFKSNFWHDDALRAVLWMKREAEIIQAIGRFRLALHPVKVWLLSSLPIDELQPDEIWTIRDIYSAPEGVDAVLWGRFLELLEIHKEQGSYLTSSEIQDILEVSGPTALLYMDLAVSHIAGWQKSESCIKGERKQHILVPMPENAMPVSDFDAAQWQQVVQYMHQVLIGKQPRLIDGRKIRILTEYDIREALGGTQKQARRIMEMLVEHADFEQVRTWQQKGVTNAS